MIHCKIWSLYPFYFNIIVGAAPHKGQERLWAILSYLDPTNVTSLWHHILKKKHCWVICEYVSVRLICFFLTIMSHSLSYTCICFSFLQVFSLFLFANRSRLTLRTQPSTTSSAPSSSRWSGTWESLSLRHWACPAPTSPLTTGACRQGRATAPPTALWPYWPWTLTARKRWALVKNGFRGHMFSFGQLL